MSRARDIYWPRSIDLKGYRLIKSSGGKMHIFILNHNTRSKDMSRLNRPSLFLALVPSPSKCFETPLPLDEKIRRVRQRRTQPGWWQEGRREEQREGIVSFLVILSIFSCYIRGVSHMLWYQLCSCLGQRVTESDILFLWWLQYAQRYVYWSSSNEWWDQASPGVVPWPRNTDTAQGRQNRGSKFVVL